MRALENAGTFALAVIVFFTVIGVLGLYPAILGLVATLAGVAGLLWRARERTGSGTSA